MKGTCFVLVCGCILTGVFGVEVTVKEGDSVTLNSDVTKQQHEIMRWYFNDILIAFINDDPDTSCLYDGEGGIFRDRLEVKYETGSLTITNIRSEHAGNYELEYIRSDDTGNIVTLNKSSKCDRTKIIRKPISDDDDDIIKSFWLMVTGVFGVEVKRVMEGDSVTLNSSVTKQHHDEIMRWYFNDTLIAYIRGGPDTSCLYDGEDGIFRDRLKVNYETGSLTITNIRSEHAGHYELEFIRRDGRGTSTSLNRRVKCDRTKILSKPINDDRIIKTFWLIVTGVFDDEVIVRVIEGDSVTLNSDVTKQPHDIMRWYFNDIRIALIIENHSKSCLYDGEGGIFRDRLEVNYETGSLNITNIRSEHAGRYELESMRRDGTGTSETKCDRTKIIPKPDSANDHIIKSLRLIITGSAQSPAAKAGIFVGVVAVVLLV